MILRLFLFEPGKIHAKFDFVLHQRYGKKQLKRNQLQLVNKGALFARRTARDCGHQTASGDDTEVCVYASLNRTPPNNRCDLNVHR
jgi:hypothetical protein